MRACLPALALLILAGCKKPADESSTLLAEAKRRLSEREARLTQYRLEGRASEGVAPPVDFTFAWRAPEKMRGSLGAPMSRTFSWNGEHLFDQSDTEKRFITFKSELPPAKLAGFLTGVFSAFVSEGFRTPLLPQSATAKRTSHALAPEAVELTAKVEDPSTQGLEVGYTMRWPSLDFLGKRTRTGDGTTMELRVEEEHCDQALQLCVPKRLTRWVNGEKVGETTLTKVELNATLPNDSFTLSPPEGYEVQTKTLVETEGQ